MLTTLTKLLAAVAAALLIIVLCLTALAPAAGASPVLRPVKPPSATQ